MERNQRKEFSKTCLAVVDLIEFQPPGACLFFYFFLFFLFFLSLGEPFLNPNAEPIAAQQFPEAH